MAGEQQTTGDMRSIAWRRAVPDHDFMRRWSMQHIVVEGTPRTLCGAEPRWAYEGPGDSRRCGRCQRIMEAR